ncbi:TadE family protein [Geodermatophilus obscurus DSM 43160]|uniref:TadE family protein n=1 Tax=Geodermatophilus obscurus (strain ATCC 25078 / DSM 43160 / JCM 3152 / CCUG 61914 / KCC A-0152 / KCTC 9177 / NBRC 13315 / NRRL B-3577 / G-20) TaxID=526225 RepID=D2S7F2_GEOOG|nr:TadE family protein [Geodermatophilus obscurus DSM 43160]
MPRPANPRGPTPPSRPRSARGQRSRRALRGPAGERGAASVELAVTFPVVLLLVMTLIQAALWFYARSVALGAAQEGAREGRVQPASTARAQAAAEGFLDQTAADLLSSRDVAVTGSATTVAVTVTGTSISLFPGLSGWSVTQTAVGPVERPTP